MKENYLFAIDSSEVREHFTPILEKIGIEIDEPCVIDLAMIIRHVMKRMKNIDENNYDSKKIGKLAKKTSSTYKAST